MADPLTSWWVHSLTVERFTGATAYGDNWAAPEAVAGLYDDRTVYGVDGEVRAVGKFAFPRSVAFIPLQSRVTLPSEFGGRACRVVGVSVLDAGPLPVPAHQQVELL